LLLHPEFNEPLAWDNDVTWLWFSSPLQVSQSPTLCGPLASGTSTSILFQHRKQNRSGKITVKLLKLSGPTLFSKVTGFKQTENYTLAYELQEANLRIKPHLQCYLRKRSFFGNHLKPGRNFCAGGDGKVASFFEVSKARTDFLFSLAGSTACVGDSGGGFALKKGRKWYLRGVVSFGKTFTKEIAREEMISVCKVSWPSLYNDVANQMDWIKQNAFPHSTPAPPSLGRNQFLGEV
jgi:secreted trypsin-like serine protease